MADIRKVNLKELQAALVDLWDSIHTHCTNGNIRMVPELVAKLRQCTALTATGTVRMVWGKVCYKRPLPFILRALIENAHKAPIGELDLSENQVGDEHAKLLITYINSSTHLRQIDLSKNLFSPSVAEALRSAARRDVYIVGITQASPKLHPERSPLPPRPLPSPRTHTPPPNHTADTFAVLQHELDTKVRSLGLQHAGQLEPERDRLLREMHLSKPEEPTAVLNTLRSSVRRESKRSVTAGTQSEPSLPSPSPLSMSQVPSNPSTPRSQPQHQLPQEQQEQQQIQSQPQRQVHPQQQPPATPVSASIPVQLQSQQQTRLQQQPPAPTPVSVPVAVQHSPMPVQYSQPQQQYQPLSQQYQQPQSQPVQQQSQAQQNTTPGGTPRGTQQHSYNVDPPSSGYHARPLDVRGSPRTVIQPHPTVPATPDIEGEVNFDDDSLVHPSPFRQFNAHSLVSKRTPMSVPSKHRTQSEPSPLGKSLIKTEEVIMEGDKEDLYDIAQDNTAEAVIRDFSKMKISSVEHKDLSRITVLVLRNNMLRELTNMPSCLVKLDVSGNLLQSIQGLENCVQLEVFNARRNRITRIGNGLTFNRLVHTLLLGRNQIRRVEGLEHLTDLSYLDLSHNELSTPVSVRTLSINAGLKTLVLRGNPLSHPSGRRRVCLSNLPQTCNEAGVQALLRPYGSVEGVTVIHNRTTKEGRLAAFASFADADDVAKACATALNAQGVAGMPPFTVEVKGKKGRIVVSRLFSSMDKSSMMQLLSMHGMVESLEMTQPKWEHKSATTWIPFDSEYTARLDAAHHRQGTCKIRNFTVRMTNMTAERDDGTVCNIRLHREAMAVFAPGTMCAEKAKAALSRVKWQGDTVPLVVRHMPDYQLLLQNLIPGLHNLDGKYLNVAHKESLNTTNNTTQSQSMISETSAIDMSTSAAQRVLKGESFEQVKIVPVAGYAKPGKAKQMVKRIGRAQERQQKEDQKLRKYGLQPSQQGSIVKEHTKRSKSVPSKKSIVPPLPDLSDIEATDVKSSRSRSVEVKPTRNIVPAAFRRKAPPTQETTPKAARRRANSTPSRYLATSRNSSRSNTPMSRASVNNTSMDSNGELRSALRRLSTAVSETSKPGKRGVSFGDREYARDTTHLYSYSDADTIETTDMEYSRSETLGQNVSILTQDEQMGQEAYAALQTHGQNADLELSYSKVSAPTPPPVPVSVPGSIPITPGRKPPPHPARASPKLQEALLGVEQTVEAAQQSPKITTPRKQQPSPKPLRQEPPASPQVSDALQSLYAQLQALHEELSTGGKDMSPQAFLRLMTPVKDQAEQAKRLLSPRKEVENLPTPSLPTPIHEKSVPEKEPEKPVTLPTEPEREPEPAEVTEWMKKVVEDFLRAHLALKALVVLSMEAKKEEQDRYKGIIEGSGMLSDTEVPSCVVRHFKLTEANLNAPIEVHPKTKLEGLLAILRQLSDTKTSLKYIFALIAQSNPEALCEYVERVKTSSLVTREPSTFVLPVR